MKKIILCLVGVMVFALVGCSTKKDDMINEIEGKMTFKTLIYLSSFSSETADFFIDKYKNKTVVLSKDEFIDKNGEKIESPNIIIKKMSRNDIINFERDYQIGIELNKEGTQKLDMSKYKKIYQVNITSDDEKTTRILYYVDGQIWYKEKLALILMTK